MATTVTLSELLQPQFVLDLISRVRPGQGAIGKWLGFQPNRFDPNSVALSGPATISGDLRNVTYRIFNAVRSVASGRAPGTGPGTIAENPMGQVQISCARFWEKIPLNYEMLGNLSPMIGPNSNIDAIGQSYIKQQSMFLARRMAMMAEMLSAAMMRDSLWLIMQGDNWTPSFTAPVFPQIGLQVNFQIPAGNKNKLNMLGLGDIITVSWGNVGAPILQNVASIKAAFAQLHGWPLTDVWINSLMWPNLITNTGLRNAAGSSQTPFAEYKWTEERGMDGVPTGKYMAVLAADPTITWHIDDDIISQGNSVDISYSYSTGTAQKLIPDNMAIFTTSASPENAKMYLGGEPVVENPGMPAVIRRGYYSWSEYVTQPSAIDLLSLGNMIPCLYNPLVFAPATVVF
jgi:hypothetical protein